jgi:hypothetical protein
MEKGNCFFVKNLKITDNYIRLSIKELDVLKYF